MPIIKEEPLSKYDPSTFTFTRCKSEVSQAMHEDWKYDKIDDAKKRAIYDAKNYDEFKDRVAGCTLKPIHRNEFNAPPKYAFNRSANAPAGADRAVGSSADAQVSIPKRGSVIIKTSREFDRELRRCSSEQDKVTLLQRLSEDDLVRLFSRELDAEVLRQLILALDETLGTEAAPLGSAHRFLSALATNCPTSAATAASFLINAERAAVARLLAIESRGQGGDPSDNIRICAALGVPPKMLDAATAEVEAKAAASQASGAEGAPPDGVVAGGAGVAAAEPKEAAAVPETAALRQDGVCTGVGGAEAQVASTAVQGDQASTSCSATGTMGFGGCDTLD